MPRPRASPVRRPVRTRRRPRLPARRLRRRPDRGAESCVIEMPQPVFDRIRLHVRGGFVHDDSCANVFCSRSGARSGPVKNGDRTGARARARCGLTPAPCVAADAPRDIRRSGVEVVVERRVRRAAPAPVGRMPPGSTRPGTGDDVAGRVATGPATAGGRPGLVIPDADGAAGIEADALIDDEGVAVVLPRHFVLPRQLHADRPADGLREQRRVVGHRVGAVDAVTAGATHVDDTHVLGPQAKQHRSRCCASDTPTASPTTASPVALHVGDRAGSAD